MKKKYVFVIFAVALGVVGVLVASKLNKPTPVRVPTPAKVVAPVVEATTARMDLFSKPYTKDAKFIVYKGSEDKPIQEAGWMQKRNMRGCTLQMNGNETTFIIKTKGDVDVSIALRGPYKLDDSKKTVPVWVDYTSLTVNGKEVLSEKTAVWHDRPFTHVINAKAGETYIVSAKWQKHTETKK